MEKNKYVAPAIQIVELEISEILAATVSNDGSSLGTGNPLTEGDATQAVSKKNFEFDIWEE